MTANQIAENIFSHVDDKGKEQLLLKEISNHRKGPPAISRTRHLLHTTMVTNTDQRPLKDGTFLLCGKMGQLIGYP